MRKIFFQTLEGAAKEDKSIFMLVAGLGIKFFQNFREIDPKRFINVGVAESNMIGLSAGLAMSGKNVYCYSIIPFLTMRTFEQIRINICYNNLDVKLLGAGGGLVYGIEGMTHHAIEDIAIMRALPNMTVVAPGDALEAQALSKASLVHKGPLYIRFGRDVDPLVHQESNFNFEIGKGIVVRPGKEVCLIAVGTMLYQTKLAIDLLLEDGISPTFVSMHTIKPIDEELIKDLAKNHKIIFTIEEHNIIGGLGSAVSEILSENNYCGFFKRLGILDQYSHCLGIGDASHLLAINKLNPENIYGSIMEECKNKNILF